MGPKGLPVVPRRVLAVPMCCLWGPAAPVPWPRLCSLSYLTFSLGLVPTLPQCHRMYYALLAKSSSRLGSSTILQCTAINSNTLKVKAGESGVQSHPQLPASSRPPWTIWEPISAKQDKIKQRPTLSDPFHYFQPQAVTTTRAPLRVTWTLSTPGRAYQTHGPLKKRPVFMFMLVPHLVLRKYLFQGSAYEDAWCQV